ncbi:MAG: dTDP-4-dehydrorhamnose reductase [Chrysiogenales bacterium]|nr:dTDP-4-dehydrorhamnose reductase [Candidatus Aminicenantes bacterium]TFG79487.1 MAG: dTDP-4-dehydrorhamnose reductase [Chrysiogenales bacterium]
MKLAVIGADGQLGSDIVELFRAECFDVVPLTIDRLDIADNRQVQRVLAEAGADVIINTAAMHQVEKCEADPLKAFAVNALGARNIAQAANAGSSRLIHISTDYVFSGEKMEPYLENDCPLPLNAYANSKLAGELFVRSLAQKHYVIRVSGLYGKNPCLEKGGLNFVDLMLKLARERSEVRVVDDEVLTPTATKEVARQILKMLNGQAEDGLYHATAEGSCSWFEFAREIFSLSHSTVTLNKAEPGEFPAKVPRPSYSVLENHNLKKQNLNGMSFWKDALKEYLKEKHHIG